MNAKHLTQSKLGEIVKIRQTTISDYLNGKSVPSADVFMRIAFALEMPMDWFCGIETTLEDGKTSPSALLKAQQEITRLKAKLCSARKTLEGAYSLALEALELEEEKENVK